MMALVTHFEESWQPSKLQLFMVVIYLREKLLVEVLMALPANVVDLRGVPLASRWITDVSLSVLNSESIV